MNAASTKPKVRKLLIRVDGKPSGYLSARDIGAHGIRYSYSYVPGAGPEQALSVTMPVPAPEEDRNVYDAVYLPPVLEMGMPEGILEDHLIQQFTKILTVDEMGLLFITGHSRVGNITAELPPDNKDTELAALAERLRKHHLQQGAIEADEVISVSDDDIETLFGRLLDQYAVDSGVSGMQPKVLARTLVRSKGVEKRFTGSTPNYIVKTSEQQYPYLALNENLCLCVAALAGLDVPRRIVSENGEAILLRRFDLKRGRGGRYYFEDGCALLGLPSTKKYESSIENLTQALLGAVPGMHRRAAAVSLFTLIVVNTLIRNGDGHLKNFAIMYDRPGNARLSKCYDINTTAAYPNLRHDKPALRMHGSHRWPNEQELLQYGRRACQLEERACKKLIHDVIRGVEKTGETIPKVIAAHPGSEHVLSAMVVQWNNAIKSLYYKKDGDKKKIKTDLDDVEKTLLEQYGDPYRNQRGRKERAGSKGDPDRRHQDIRVLSP